MKIEELMVLNEEIAAMARAGLPLDQGLSAMAQEMGGGRLRRITEELAADLQRGSTLPEALQRQGQRVPPYYAALLAAGVRTGRVVDVLATLTRYARSMADLRSLLFTATIYPMIVLGVTGFLFGFLCYFIVPQFHRIFQDFNLRLPFLTMMVIEVAQNPLLWIGLPFVVVVSIVGITRMLLLRSERGQVYWAKFLYSLPVLGAFLRAIRIAAFTELLAVLVENQIPLPEALSLASQASNEPALAAASVPIRKQVEEGQTLAEAFRSHRAVPELIAWIVSTGEQRGNLGAALHHVSEVYRSQAELRASLLRSLLPPLLIVFSAGVLVTLFVMAVMLPMIKLLEGLSH